MFTMKIIEIKNIFGLIQFTKRPKYYILILQCSNHFLIWRNSKVWKGKKNIFLKIGTSKNNLLPAFIQDVLQKAD